MNRELLRRVRDRIAEVGEWGFDMGLWAVPSDGECGTTACLAGWSCLLGMNLNESASWTWVKKDGRGIHWQEDATRLLDMSYDQADRLFFTTSWPVKYQIIAKEEGEDKAAIQLLDDIIDGLLVWDEGAAQWRHVAEIEEELAAEFDDAEG